MPFDTEQITLDSGVVVLVLSGTMTMGNLLQKLEWVVRDLTKENHNRIVIDLANITYLDSASIGVLLNCSAMVKNGGGQLRLAALSDRVLSTLKLVGLDGVLPISPSRDEAAAEIAPHP